jgi:hypothetical protein
VTAKLCRILAPRQDLVAGCSQCGHTNLLHPGAHNPDLNECLICLLKEMLPPKHGPDPAVPVAGLPAVLLHLVVEPGTWRVGATLDQATAHAKAQEIQGLVGDVIASADYRPRQETPQQKHSREMAELQAAEQRRRRRAEEDAQRRPTDQR